MTNLHLYIIDVFDFKAQTIINIHIQHTVFTQNNKKPPAEPNRRKKFPASNPKIKFSQYRTKGEITKNPPLDPSLPLYKFSTIILLHSMV